MAIKINSQVQSYESVRGTLRDGDIVLVAGDSLLGRIIQRFTSSIWTHCGILFWAFDRLILVHATEKGVVGFPFSKYVNPHPALSLGKGEGKDEAIVIGRHRAIRDEARQQGSEAARQEGKDHNSPLPTRHSPLACAMGRFAADHLGCEYDHAELLKIAHRIIAGRGRLEKNDAFICSELVAECYEAAELSLNYDKRGFIAPDNIAEAEDIELVARVR